MMMEENIVRCSKDEAMQHLKAKFNGCMRIWSVIYIGATPDLPRRFAQPEQRSVGLRKMVVLYEAFTPPIALMRETNLIAYARGCTSPRL